MSTPSIPSPAQLFISIIFRGGPDPVDTNEVTAAIAALKAEYGPVDIMSPVMPFEYTAYYYKEMGKPLWRRILSFKELVVRSRLVEIKHQCMQLEHPYRDADGRRRLNIDPGLVSQENFILATGKNIAHRVYLDRGIFADLTLIYHSRKFNALPWTYPDYASPEIQEILLQMRRNMLQTLNQPRLSPQENPANPVTPPQDR